MRFRAGSGTLLLGIRTTLGLLEHRSFQQNQKKAGCSLQKLSQSHIGISVMAGTFKASHPAIQDNGVRIRQVDKSLPLERSKNPAQCRDSNAMVIGYIQPGHCQRERAGWYPSLGVALTETAQEIDNPLLRI